MDQTRTSYERDRHPLSRDAAILPTHAVERFVNAIRMWMDNLLPGAIVWGVFRVGKTQAIRYLRANVNELLGSQIPTYLLSVMDMEPLTKNQFYQEMLHMLGYPLPDSGTAAKKRRRTIDALIELARAAQEHRVLLFVDEAQWLTEMLYRCLMDLHNQLKENDIRLIVILVGQPELMEQKEALRSARKGHLVGRFMTCTHRFYGVRDASDLRRMLWAMDVGSEFPAGSGVSYTEFFLPKAFLAGWRLERHANLIWACIENAMHKHEIPSVAELPMQAIAALIRALVRDLAEQDCSDFELDEAAVIVVLERVALLQIIDHALQTAPNTRARLALTGK